MSLTALARGEPFTGTRDIFSELGVDALSNPDWFAPHYPLQAIRRGEWKYIHQIGAGGADELYQLEPASLYETHNLIQTEPGIAAELLDALFNRFGPTRSVYLPNIMKGIPH
jgi:hypothetical protein